MPEENRLETSDAANSEKTAKKRGRPFQKGQSGNPNGRPKIPKEVKELLKAATPDAARLLALTVCDDTADLKLRVDIAKTILDRVYGKAAQPIDGGLDAKIEVILQGELADYGA